MKILIPVIGFGTAGGYRVLSELANHWLAAGHHVDFLVDSRSGAPYFPTRAGILRFNKKGVITETSQNDATVAFATTGNALSIYTGMWRACKRISANYDVIFANHSLTTFPIFFAGTGSAAKIYYVQAYEPEYYALEKGIKARVLKWLSTLSYELPFKQIANAPIYIGYRRLRAKSWVPPGIDETIFFRRPSPPSFHSPDPTILGVIGRREPAKGTQYVLDAFLQLAKSDPTIRLKVAFGNLPDNWTHERAEVVIPDSDRELADFYRSVDILLAPGTVQLGACHYPVLEAMACGTPVVTTGYLPANEQNASIVPVHDSHAIAAAVREIQHATPAQRDQKLNAAFLAMDQFHWKNVAGQFIALMQS